jgi:hypothetical protein
MQEDWLKPLLENMEQARRDSEQRQAAAVERIERLIERQADAANAVRAEILAKIDKVNDATDRARAEITSRVDQAYTHFESSKSASSLAVYSTIGAAVTVIVAVAAIAIATWVR